MSLQTNPKTLRAGVFLATLMLGGGGGYASLEGREATPYRDVGGIWTDCYGNTHAVNPNRIRSEKECRKLLDGEADELGDKIYAKVQGKITGETLASYISLSYNIGYGAFSRSTLLKKHLAGDYVGACKQILRWAKVKGKFSRGLYKRRKIEFVTCMKGVPQYDY